MKIEKLLDNSIAIPSDIQFAAIVGGNPSNGARSPLLWNSVFEAFDSNRVMLPMDVSAENLKYLLDMLDSNSQFIGGSIAMPHKESVAQWLSLRGGKYISKEASTIGAVNCLYRNGEGRLCGTNTDGEGALISLKKMVQDLSGKKIIQLGVGGAGKAVAAYVSGALENGGKLVLSVRDSNSVEKFAGKIDAEIIQWPPRPQDLVDVDILINCTSIGSNCTQQIDGDVVNMSEYSPLAKLGDTKGEELSVLAMKHEAIVFDIIYDPSPTRLLEICSYHGHEVLDGSFMNLEQAIISFSYGTDCVV